MRVICIVLLAFVACTTAMGRGGGSYCSISPQHTMCRYQGIGGSCGAPISRGLSRGEKDALLHEHNQLRQRVARGKEHRGRSGPQPPASNMIELQWDEEVANVAQRWADQCIFSHDAERGTQRHGNVGQNIYQSFRSNDEGNNAMIKGSIKSWYDGEVKQFDGNSVRSYRFNSGTGHYTQMVWANTTHIGCGQTTYRGNNGFLVKYLVCNYGPAGNFQGQAMYEVGQACSRCQHGCSSRYQGLCRNPGSGSSHVPTNSFNNNNNNNNNNFTNNNNNQGFFNNGHNSFSNTKPPVTFIDNNQINHNNGFGNNFNHHPQNNNFFPTHPSPPTTHHNQRPIFTTQHFPQHTPTHNFGAPPPPRHPTHFQRPSKSKGWFSNFMHTLMRPFGR